MNKVAKITPAQSASLQELRLYASRYPRLGQIPETDAITQMIPIVQMAFAYKGQPTDAENIRFIASTLIGELLMDSTYGLKGITIEECRRAIKKAVLTDNNFFVSVSSIYRVIVDYAKGEGHQIEEQLKNRHYEHLDKTIIESAPGAMIQMYTGAFLKNNKI